MTLKAVVKEVLNFTSHNTGITLAACLVFCIVIWIFGCDPKVQSLIDPTQRITRAELAIEVDTFLAMAEIRYGQLEQKERLKQMVFKHALLFAEGGAVNPYGIMMSLQAIIGTGAIVDNMTKRRKESKALKRYTDVIAEKDKK